jgi:fluoroacetyl-CoA thioesterase
MKSKRKSSAKRPPHRATKTASLVPPPKCAENSAPTSIEESRPRIGLEGTAERVVPHEWTIEAFDPRLPPVLSTPAMIGLMEHATVNAVREHLPAGAISVGTRIEVDHLKAVPGGATVRAHARLVGYEGRFLVFEVEAWSGQHIIGRGRVFRAIVKPELHDAKAKARVES